MGFYCGRDCPRKNKCPSVSRNYPCSVYMALRSHRIDSNELESETQGKLHERKYDALKSKYESE